MDFNALYLEFAPYINAIILFIGGGGLGTLIAKIISSVKRELSEIRQKADVAEIFKNALPKDFTVNIEAMAKKEIMRILAEIKAEFISPLQKMETTLKTVAKAIASLRTVPDEIKNEIGTQIDEGIKTVESLKVELSPEIAEAAEPQYLPEEL